MKNNQKLRHIFVFHHSPFASDLCSSGLDLALTMSAYEQDVMIIFLGDGVFNLLPDKNSQGIGVKDFTRVLSSLDIYDINELYVESQSIQLLGMQEQQLPFKFKTLHQKQLHEEIQKADRVYCY